MAFFRARLVRVALLLLAVECLFWFSLCTIRQGIHEENQASGTSFRTSSQMRPRTVTAVGPPVGHVPIRVFLRLFFVSLYSHRKLLPTFDLDRDGFAKR